jgi:hypothetical protein
MPLPHAQVIPIESEIQRDSLELIRRQLAEQLGKHNQLNSFYMFFAPSGVI